MKKLVLFLAVLAFVFAPLADVQARGGGGSRVGGGRSSVSRPSTPKPKPIKTDAVKPAPKPKPQEVKSATPVTSSTGKKMKATGAKVDDNYKPTFRGGYTPPTGSTVYYNQRGFMDYLPWIFLFTQDSHREVVVETPDGKQETHTEESVDSMYVWNWIFSILVGLGAVGLVVWLMNRRKYS